MNILVLNCGSSSAKYKLIEIKNNKTLAEGGVEKIGLPDAFIKLKFDDGSKKVIDLDITDHIGAIKAILDALTHPEHGCIADLRRSTLWVTAWCTAASASARACSSPMR